jgi:hypothetical protein
MLLLTQFESILHPKLPIVVLVPWSKQASKHAGPPAYIRLPLFFLYQILENNKKGKGADALRL